MAKFNGIKAIFYWVGAVTSFFFSLIYSATHREGSAALIGAYTILVFMGAAEATVYILKKRDKDERVNR